MFEQPTHQAYHCPKDTPRSSSGLEKPFPPQERDANMSLTRFSRPFTISTYDPPSTPIALAAQDTGQTATVLAVNEQGYRLGGDTAAPRTRASIVGASEVWGRLRNTQATPPAKNKILQWVAGVENVAEGWTPPEGMFGPYPSRPPTTFQPREQQQRNKHPFAYDTQRTRPFSALASEVNFETALAEDLARGKRPVSDILNRGVGKGRNRDSTPAETSGSPGMGTFGIEASQDPVSSSEAVPPPPPKSPSKTPKNSRKPPPKEDDDLTTARAQMHPMANVAAAIDQTQTGPNVKGHHEHPFDPVEAAGKEQAALAHIEALRQLTGASGGPVIPHTNTGTKGPRDTYETATSVPSFGHILHRDGVPVSRHMSFQQETFVPGHGPIVLGQGAVTRELAGLSGTGFFHVPYGPDVRLRFGANLPGGPLSGMLDVLGAPVDIPPNSGTHAGKLGVLGGARLGAIAESPVSEIQRKDDKSAYVESITDEQDPTIKTGQSRAISKIHPGIVPAQANLDHARPESGVHPDGAQEPGMSRAGDGDPNATSSKKSSKARTKEAKISKDKKAKSHKTTSAVPHARGTKPVSEVPIMRPPAPAHPAYTATPVMPALPTHTAPDHRATSAASTMPLHARVQPVSQTPVAPLGDRPTQDEVEADLVSRLGPVLGPMVAYEMKQAQAQHIAVPRSTLHDWPAPDGKASLPSRLPTQGTMTPHQAMLGKQGRISSMDTHGTYVPSQASPRETIRELDEEYATLRSPATVASIETTPSKVKHLVSESKFHDETLCQLLDAAGLNLIGPDAKRALQRAARARVIELRDMRANGELGGADLPMPSLHRTPPKKNKQREKLRRSSSRDGRSRRSDEHAARPTQTPGVDEVARPWEQTREVVQLLSRMTEFEARLADSNAHGSSAHDHPPGHQQDDTFEIPPTLLNDLIFNMDPSPIRGSPALHGPHGQHGIHGLHGAIPFDAFPFPFPIASSSTISPPGGAYLKTISTDDKGSRQSKANGTVLDWGSEVELPGDTRVSPPKSMARSARDATPGPVIPPTIHIQPPTESNMGKSMGVPTASVAGTTRTERTPAPVVTRSVGAHTPPQSGVHDSAASTQSVSLPPAQPRSAGPSNSLPQTVLPNPLERDLPPPPSESIRSNRPTTPPKSTPFGPSVPSAAKTSLGERGDTPISLREALAANVPLAQSMASQSAFGPLGTTSDPSGYGLGRVPAVPLVPAIPTVPSPNTHTVKLASAGASSARLPVSSPEGQAQQAMATSTFTAYKTALQSVPATPRRPVDTIPIVDPDTSHKPEPQPWDCVQQRLYSWAVVWEDSSFSQALEDISLGKQVGEFALSIFVMMTFKRMLKRSLTETPSRPVHKLFVPPTFAEAISQAIYAFTAAQQMLEELWYPFMFKDPPRVIVALTRHPNNPDVWFAHRFDLASGHLRTYRVGPRPEVHDGRPFHWWFAIKQAWPQCSSKKDILDSAAQTHEIDFDPAKSEQNSLIAMNVARNLFLGFRPENKVDISKLRESVWGEVKRLRDKKRGGRLMVDLDSPSMTTS